MNEQKLPSTWKLVPLDPTEAMMQAAWACANTLHGTPDGDDPLPGHQYRAMLEVAPQPGWPNWSSATAPGPDGMQHCIAVPGMPSAARDAELEETGWVHYETLDVMAKMEEKHNPELLNISRALKSIAGPVAGAPTITYGPKGDVAITEHNADDQPVLRVPLASSAALWAQFEQWVRNQGISASDVIVIHDEATPAPVQQAAPSGPCAVQGAEKLPLCVGTCAKQGQCIEQAAPSGIDEKAGGLFEVPKGYQLVPVKMTQRMKQASKEFAWSHRSEAARYAAILEASPRVVLPTAAPAQPAGLSDDIEERTEKIRLAHANPHTRSKTQLIRDVEYLLSHIAVLRSLPAGLSEQDKLDAARYRYLRNPDPQPARVLDVVDNNSFIVEGKALDEEIDAAILAAKEAP